MSNSPKKYSEAKILWDKAWIEEHPPKSWDADLGDRQCNVSNLNH